MRFPDKFRLFAVLKVAAGRLLTTLMHALVLAAAVVSLSAAASAGLSASSGVHGEAALAQTGLSLRSAAPRAPDQSTPCFDRHHPCMPGVAVAAPVHGEPLLIVVTGRASFVAPRAQERVGVPGIVPHPAAPLSILFQNFRK